MRKNRLIRLVFDASHIAMNNIEYWIHSVADPCSQDAWSSKPVRLLHSGLEMRLAAVSSSCATLVKKED